MEIESGEQFLLKIMSEHLQVTERLLESHASLYSVICLQPGMRERLPAPAKNLREQDLLDATRKLRDQVQSILDR